LPNLKIPLKPREISVPQVFDNSYKNIVKKVIDDPELTPFRRANWVAEALFEETSKDGGYRYDYGTITKGIIEAWQGKIT